MYPPTLNAIHELAGMFEKVIVLYRNSVFNDWVYPDNVILIPHGRDISIRQQEQLSTLQKIFAFAGFTFKQYKTCLKYRPEQVLLYDSIALFSHHLIRRVLPAKPVWYHSHDVAESGSVRKYSIAWFSFSAEKRAFNYIDMFTLPAKERLQYFPVEKLKGKYFVIPNYPLLAFYKKFYAKKQLAQNVRLIYQGHISELHGIEQIIELLPEKIGGYEIFLVLKGPCKEEYKKQLEKRVTELGVIEKVQFIGVTAYAEVPAICSTCHIGIGIHAKQDFMNTSLGTASNKLYEYAAVGLPVLYYKNSHFDDYLGVYDWAFATSLNTDDIHQQIGEIITNYSEISASANSDFVNELHFEKQFEPAAAYLQQVHKNLQLN